MPDDPRIPPWQGRSASELGHNERHDPTTCRICKVDPAAWARGVARANATQTHLPLTSTEPDVRPGRDGYQQ